MEAANKEEGREGGEGGVAPLPASGVGISRLHPNGVSRRGYRTIEYILRSSDCVDNRHLRRLTGGGTHGGRRELYENAFSSYEESSDEETKGECLPMESWAENFMRLLLYDERGSHIAKKGKKLKKVRQIRNIIVTSVFSWLSLHNFLMISSSLMYVHNRTWLTVSRLWSV